jgi:hypothetical protein
MAVSIEVPDDVELWRAHITADPIPLVDAAGIAAGAVARELGAEITRGKVLLSYDGHLVCRLFVDGGACVYFKTGEDAEPWIYGTVRALSVPAPEVLCVDRSCAAFLLPFFVTGDVGGRPLERHEAGRFTEALNTAGRNLALVHSVDIDGFGRILDGGRGTSRDWWTWLSDGVTASADEAVHLDLLSADESVAIATTFRRVATILPQPRSALLHGDFLTRHIYVANERILTGLIDFFPMSGDPLFDFAVTSLWDGAIAGAVGDGYGAIDVRQPQWTLYRQWRALEEAVFMHKVDLDVSGQLRVVRECARSLG